MAVGYGYVSAGLDYTRRVWSGPYADTPETYTLTVAATVTAVAPCWIPVRSTPNCLNTKRHIRSESGILNGLGRILIVSFDTADVVREILDGIGCTYFAGEISMVSELVVEDELDPAIATDDALTAWPAVP